MVWSRVARWDPSTHSMSRASVGYGLDVGSEGVEVDGNEVGSDVTTF